MAHATNDVSAIVMTAGGGVMSAVDASITALVTLATMFFVLDWRVTLVAIIPLPLFSDCDKTSSFVLSIKVSKNHKKLSRYSITM